MRILVVGASGTIGKAVIDELQDDNVEIIKASRSNSDVSVDISSPESILAMFDEVGQVDALVSAAGETHFGLVEEMTPEQNQLTVNSKLLGQINLVLLGLNSIRDKGSITLTTGITMDDPLVTGASAAMASGGIRAFVKSAAIELPRGIRINTVSPNVLEESAEKYATLFVGYEPVPSKRVSLAYKKSVYGAQTGECYYVY